MKRRIDPRWYVLINNTLLLLLGMKFFGLQRDALQVIFCLVMGNAAEILAAWVLKKHPTVRVGDRLLSATIACLSVLILVRSSDWWFYGLLATTAILSKYLLVNERGRHFFNPSDFAIVFALAFLPDHLFFRPDQFSRNAFSFDILLPMIVGFGAAAAIGAARWREVAAYYLVVVFVGVPAGLLLGIKYQWVIAPELNTSTLIFSFLMLTDPRTTPSSNRSQWIFGGLVAGLHLTLRYFQIPYSPFISLFVVSGLWSVLGHLVERAAGPEPVGASALTGKTSAAAGRAWGFSKWNFS